MTAPATARRSASIVAPRRASRAPRRALTIGLVNNMPDPALAATERQFRDLVMAQADAFDLRFRVFFFPDIARGKAGAAYCVAHYEPIEALFASDVDALLVSGCEPGAGPMRQEPYWPDFARLVDWAATHTASTLWSCLAAHAAVLHLDGIERRRLPHKLSGVFACDIRGDHPLVAGTGDPYLVPHSRLNGVSEADLVERGYEVLTRSDAVGVDLAVKAVPSLFVFLQGHPEYGADSLPREFRRDVGRYLAGTQNAFPSLPQGIFDEARTAALTAFADAARADRGRVGLADLPSLEASDAPWRDTTLALYRTWIGLVAARGRQARVVALG